MCRCARSSACTARASHRIPASATADTAAQTAQSVSYGAYTFNFRGGSRYRRTRLCQPESGMIGQALIGIKTADGKHNFKTFLLFLNFKISSHSGIFPTLAALNAICRFRMQFSLKGI